MAANGIPVIDFGSYYESQSTQQAIADAVAEALRQHSCFLLINHGISDRQLEDAKHCSRRFFELPLDIRNESAREPGFHPCSGYFGMGVEINATEENQGGIVPEVRECFDLLLHSPPPARNAETQKLIESMETLIKSCAKLTMDLFDCICDGSHLDASERANLFSAHQYMGEVAKSSTMLRSAWYPPMLDEQLTDHTRIAPHTDFGTLSLIFQDDIGGLEVDPNLGHFVAVPQLPGAVLVIAADVLEYWTSGGIRATIHRVVPSEHNYRQTRHSFVFFVDPDYEAPIVPFGQVDPNVPIRLAKEMVLHRYKMAFDHHHDSSSQSANVDSTGTVRAADE